MCACACVFVRPHLRGHFRSMDQTCEDVFFLRGLFFGSSENVCVFCESLQQYKNLYACVRVCVRTARNDEQFEAVKRRRYLLYSTRRTTTGSADRPCRVSVQVQNRRQSTKGLDCMSAFSMHAIS